MAPKNTHTKLDTRELDNLVRNLDKRVGKAIRALAFSVEGKAKTLAPVDTGALKNSINTSKQDEATYHVADGVEYGVHQELGTSKMSAQPFMVPAVEFVGRNVLPEIMEAFT